MKNLEQWCRIICIVTIMSGLLLTLVPKNKLKSSIKSLTIILIIYSAILSFGSVDINDLKVDFYTYEKYSNKINDLPTEQLIAYSEKMLEKEIDTYIKQLNLNAQSKVIINSENNEAEIKKIEIKGKIDDKYKNMIEKRIKEEIKDDLIIDFSG